MFSGIRTDNTCPLGPFFFFFKAEPVSSKLRTHVQKELDRGAESHSQLQIFPVSLRHPVFVEQLSGMLRVINRYSLWYVYCVPGNQDISLGLNSLRFMILR
jgi:hypothetical protein